MQIQHLSPPVQRFLLKSQQHFAFPQLEAGILRSHSFAVFNSTGEDKAAVFKAGSLTKLVTGLAVLLCQEKGLLNIHQPAAKCLPWLPGKATVLDLLLHTGGIPRGKLWKCNPGLQEIQSALSRLPGEDIRTGQYRYSNLGFILLGFIIQQVTGTCYEQYITGQVLVPLHMHASGFGNKESGSITTPHTLLHFYAAANHPYPLKAVQLEAAPHAAFDLHTTIPDFSRLLYCLLHQGTYGGKQVFQPATVDLLLQLHQPAGKRVSTGIGHLRTQAHNGVLLFQSGEHFGHSASLLWHVEKQQVYLAMTNRGGASSELAYVLQCLNRYYLQNGNTTALNFNYPGTGNFTGTYQYNATVFSISKAGNNLQLTSGRHRSDLIYKGQGIFQQTLPHWGRYFIRADMNGQTAKGLFVGPCYFHKTGHNETLPGHKEPPHTTAGIYQHPAVGRVAVFMRNKQLILAYAPLKESRLHPIADNHYVQTDGPFCGEAVIFDTHHHQMLLGGFDFRKTPYHY
ncbi:serine hydrolase domain-containing protein [Deminuibacter soli]|uniref:serine hydrolase domain-containing protein n=1 Tax=Deminuibacter soli TaxID=2291815 RepID=UPI0013140037|nr:serine hydrolase domain-containing protein [Deminuibacter soli]